MARTRPPPASAPDDVVGHPHLSAQSSELETHPRDERGKAGEVHSKSDSKITWVITSDSEYVVLRTTEWVPSWKVSHAQLRCLSAIPELICRNRATGGVTPRESVQRIWTSSGGSTRPSTTTNASSVCIAFWHISRVDNELADHLAGKATQSNQLSRSTHDTDHHFQ